MFYLGGQQRTYLSRWRLILKHYSEIRARLYNSAGLLEETKLALYTINQTTLVSDHFCYVNLCQFLTLKLKWYKDRARREEIISRMQGLELPAPPLLAETDLPPAREQPSSPPAPPGPVHHFTEPQDTTGQARRRATAGSGQRVGPRVLCRIIPASHPGTSSVTTIRTPSSISAPTIITTAMPVYNLNYL